MTNGVFMGNSINKSKFQLILSMIIFGTIGVFRKYIDIPSSVLAMARGFIGMFFLLAVIALKKEKLSIRALKSNLLFLILSGTFIGFNWILLFESYNYTSVAVATLCYYMAPVIVMILSPIVLKETLSLAKILSVIAAMLGMFFVSGVISNGVTSIQEMKGVFCGLGAALLYALVILLNKKIKNISPFDKTIYQLGIAGLVLFLYTYLTEDLSLINPDYKSLFLLFVVGIIHTGITYYLYFGSLSGLDAQTAALYSYIDPIFAIILSGIILKESMGVYEIIGTLLILGSTIFCELSPNLIKNRKEKNK